MKINFRELQSTIQSNIQTRLRTRTALGIQIKSSGINVNIVKFDGDTELVRSFAILVGADSVAANPDKAGATLAEQLRKEGVREKRCVVCIPPGWALSTATDLPDISDEDLRGYLEIQAEREFPIPVSDMRLAHSIYTLPDGKRRANIVAVPSKRLTAVERMLEVAGLRLVSLSLGLDRFVPAGPSKGAMHFLANGTHIDLVIAAGGGIAALRSLSGSVAQGEEIFDVAGFCREVRITLGGLPDLVRQQIREAHFRGPQSTAELLCTTTRDQLQRMGVDPADIDRTAEGPNVALEAAENFLRSKPVAFEFVPPQTKRWQVLLQRFDSKRRRWIVAGVLVFLFLPILAMIIQSRIESGLEAEWNGMKRKVSDLDDLQQNIRKYRPWFDPAPETLIVLEGVIASFPDSGEVWAKNLQVSEGQKVTCTGFAKNHAALLALLERLRARPEVSNLQLQQERGDAPIQFSIVLKWEANHAK